MLPERHGWLPTSNVRAPESLDLVKSRSKVKSLEGSGMAINGVGEGWVETGCLVVLTDE